MKTILDGKTLYGTENRTGLTVNVESAPNGSCSGYDTPNCGSYCNCLCNGDR